MFVTALIGLLGSVVGGLMPKTVPVVPPPPPPWYTTDNAKTGFAIGGAVVALGLIYFIWMDE